MSKIINLTIITQQGVKQYFIGQIYNGLLLNKIYDASIKKDTVFCSIYKGETSEGQLVFETINAPIEVAYSTNT